MQAYTVKRLGVEAVVEKRGPLSTIKFRYLDHFYRIKHTATEIERQLIETAEVCRPQMPDPEPQSPPTEEEPPPPPMIPDRPSGAKKEVIELLDLRGRREALGLSQYQLAEEAGTSRGCIARIEHRQKQLGQTQWTVQDSKTQVYGVKVALERLERERGSR